MKHVSYAINEGYVDYCRVSMLSLMENNPDMEVCFHILTDNLSEKAVCRLHDLATSHKCSVRIYEIPDQKVNHLDLNGWSKIAWYRLFLPELVDSNVSRLLYLDTDIIIAGSLDELFDTDLEDNSLAGCRDIMSYYPALYNRIGYDMKYGYICSGVLLMNLDYFRNHDLGNEILKFSTEHSERINFPDQDAINCVCHKTMKLLPLKYGILAPFFTDQEFMLNHKDEVTEMINDPRIIHYAGCAPWIKENYKHYYHDLFWQYANKIGGIQQKSAYSLKVKAIIAVKQFFAYCGITKYRKLLPVKSDFSLLENLLNSNPTKNK